MRCSHPFCCFVFALLITLDPSVEVIYSSVLVHRLPCAKRRASASPRNFVARPLAPPRPSVRYRRPRTQPSPASRSDGQRPPLPETSNPPGPPVIHETIRHDLCRRSVLQRGQGGSVREVGVIGSSEETAPVASPRSTRLRLRAPFRGSSAPKGPKPPKVPALRRGRPLTSQSASPTDGSDQAASSGPLDPDLARSREHSYGSHHAFKDL